jgi:hypothetical protein
MICRIDGQPVPLTAITYRELGFGQPVDLPLHDYQIIYDRKEFTDLLQADYEELLADQRHDDERTNDPHPRYFRELAYPPLEEFLKHPDYLSDAIIWYLWDDLLSLTVPTEPGVENSWKWVINSIDKAEVKDETVIITGKVFARQPAYV